jgi:hypothetical protein
MATIAGIAAIVSFVGAGVMLLLSALGLWHSRRTPSVQGAVAERGELTPVGV